MFYFVVKAERDDREIIQLDADGEFAVRWTEVLDQAYTTPTSQNRGLIGICRLFLAAKDRFWTKPWVATPMDSLITIKVLGPEYMIAPGDPVFMVASESTIIARVNFDLSWSLDWDRIAKINERPTKDVGVAALCRIFLAAKDNFITTPWW